MLQPETVKKNTPQGEPSQATFITTNAKRRRGRSFGSRSFILAENTATIKGATPSPSRSLRTTTHFAINNTQKNKSKCVIFN